jgi:hypothetical protein
MNPEIKKLTGFLLIIVPAFILVDYIGYRVLDHFFFTMHRGREFNTRQAMESISPDLLFLGASQCQGNYDPAVFERALNASVFNAGMGAQHVDYQEVIGSRVIERNQPKIIVWDFDPKLLAPDNGVYLKTGLSPYYAKDSLARKKLDAIDPFMQLKQWVFSYRYNSLLMQIVNGNFGKAEKKQGYTPYACGKLKQKEIVTADTYRGLSGDSYRKMDVMRSALKAWTSKGISVYVVVSPMYKKIEAPIEGIAAIRKICEEVGVPFYDFSQLDAVYNDPGNFRDHIHLCKRGAEIYSKHVAEILLSHEINKAE